MARSINTTDGSAPLGTVGIQGGLRLLGTIEGVRGTAPARARRRLRQVDDGRVPIVPTRTTRGVAVPSALGDVEAVAVAVLQGSRLSERLSGITSRRGAKGCGAACLSTGRRWCLRMRFQPRPRSRTASRPWMRALRNLEKAHGGKPDVAIDEVLRQKGLETQSRKSSKALLKAAIAAREKAVIKLEGLQKEEMDLTRLLLLKHQEISDAKNEAPAKAREVETLQARRLAEVDRDGSVSHASSSASCSQGQWIRIRRF